MFLTILSILLFLLGNEIHHQQSNDKGKGEKQNENYQE